jgi:hypothetical protein
VNPIETVVSLTAVVTPPSEHVLVLIVTSLLSDKLFYAVSNTLHHTARESEPRSRQQRYDSSDRQQTKSPAPEGNQENIESTPVSP